MWDTAGQEKFKTITSAYYKGAQGIIVVFDLTDRKSFDDVKNWISESEKYGNGQAVKILVGNKCDLFDDRKVSREEAEMFANNENMKYYESSAKLDQHVEAIFSALSGSMKERYAKPYVEKYKKTTTYLQPIKPNSSKPGTKTCC